MVNTKRIKKVVNMSKENLYSSSKINRSTTHIRIKKTLKIKLEEFMKKHRIKTYSEAIDILLKKR